MGNNENNRRHFVNMPYVRCYDGNAYKVERKRQMIKNRYKAVIVFKHLPHWAKVQLVEAKSAKKAEDAIRRMYKDSVLSVKVCKELQ